jgi:hypothetical protein
MPIKGISEVRRLPRLGKIRLGIQVEQPGKKTYPQATDHFVCPPEVQVALHSDKPKELPILFPVEDEQLFAQQWYRCYSGTWGLICKGNGISADRTFDKQTGALASRTTKETVRREFSCPGPQCPEYQKRQCRPVMNLMFLLPDVPGLGVWQLDTSSRRSITNINTAIDIVRDGCGRIAFVPLTLSLTPETAQPEGETKKTIHVLRLTTSLTLPELVQLAQTPAPRMLMPAPAPPEEERGPEDLFPEEVLEQAEVQAAAPSPPAPPPPPPEVPAHVGELLTWAKDRLKPPMLNQEVFKVLGVSGPMEITDLAEAWQKLKAITLAKGGSCESGN